MNDKPLSEWKRREVRARSNEIVKAIVKLAWTKREPIIYRGVRFLKHADLKRAVLKHQSDEWRAAKLIALQSEAA